MSDELRPCSRCNGSGAEPSEASITAEPYRQWIESVLRFGWECLRCGDEALVPLAGSADDQRERAERLAESHRCSLVAESVRGTTETKGASE